MSKENQPQEKEYTPEEIAEAQAQRKEFYETNLPILRLQREYEVILADIEEARTKRLGMIMRYAQLSAPPEEPAPQPKERKLKKE